MLSVICSKSDEWNKAEEGRGSPKCLSLWVKLSLICSCTRKLGFCKILWYHYKDFPFRVTSSSWFLSCVYKSSLISATSDLPAFSGSECVSKDQAFYADYPDLYFKWYFNFCLKFLLHGKRTRDKHSFARNFHLD